MRRFLAVAAVTFLAISCTKAEPIRKLEVISPHPQDIEDEFGPAFEAYYREKTGLDIKVVWRDMGGTSDDLRYIKSGFESRPTGIGVDLFFGGGNDPYLQLKELGLLESYRVADEILAGIPKDISGVPLYDDKDYTWYGTAISGFGILYNKVLLTRLGFEGELKTWEDLGNPKLFGWVGAGDPRHSGTVHMMYGIILEAYGWDRGWQVLTAIGGNARSFVKGANDITRAVVAGQVAAGGAIDFYAWTHIDRQGADKLGFVMPEGLSVINTDSIGILKGAPNEEAAKAFVDFVLSDAGQKLWYLKAGSPDGPRKNALFRMPVRTDLYEKYGNYSGVRTNPFKWGKGIQYNAELGTVRYEALNDLIGAVMVDNHDVLVAAWKAAIDSDTTDKAIGGLAGPPVKEAELTELAKTVMEDTTQRNAKIAEWYEWARKKYRVMGR